MYGAVYSAGYCTAYCTSNVDIIGTVYNSVVHSTYCIQYCNMYLGKICSALPFAQYLDTVPLVQHPSGVQYTLLGYIPFSSAQTCVPAEGYSNFAEGQPPKG